jgi:hypothetical protein
MHGSNPHSCWQWLPLVAADARCGAARHRLLFLRVEPFCRMGAGVDNFWEREVTSRFRAHDEDALEIVDELLGMIMMRHSKGQTLTGADGVPRPIVTLPEMHTHEVMIHLSDPSEHAIYMAMEAYCQEEVRCIQSLHGAMPSCRQ